MATLTLDSIDRELLTRAVRPPKGRQALRLEGRLPNGRWLVSSSRRGEPPHELIVNPGERIACNCAANTHGRRCSHAAYLAAFLAWERTQYGVTV